MSLLYNVKVEIQFTYIYAGNFYTGLDKFLKI